MGTLRLGPCAILVVLSIAAAGRAHATEARDGVDYWIAQLRAADPIAREAAARGLGLSGRVALPALGALTLAVEDRAAPVRAAACQALGKLGVDAAPAAIVLARRLADDGDADVRKAAAAALMHIGRRAEDAIPELLRALKAAPEDARVSAAEVLGRVAVAQPRVIAALESALLHDDSKRTRQTAVAALERLGRSEPDLAPLFVRALDDADAGVRERAASFFKSSPESAGAAVGKLASLATQDPIEQVRQAAADALAALGERASSAAPLFIRELSHPDVGHRTRAAKLLGRVSSGSEADVKALTNALVADSQLVVRQACRAALVRLARSHPLVVMDLAGLLTSDDDNVAREAADTLGVLGDEAGAAAEALGRAATGAAEPVRHASVAALAKLGRRAESEIPQLQMALRDRSERVRSAARRAIEAIRHDLERHPGP